MLRPMSSVTDCLLNKPNGRFDYEHNCIKVEQLRPPVTRMVTSSINWLHGNRIFVFLAFCLLKIAKP